MPGENHHRHGLCSGISLQVRVSGRVRLSIAGCAAGVLSALVPVACSSSSGSDAKHGSSSPEASALDATGADAPHHLQDARPDEVQEGSRLDAHDASAADVAVLEEQASDALDQMLLSYWSQADGYLVDTPGGDTVAGYWIFAQSFDALLDGVERTGGEHYLGLVQTFYDAQNAIGWSRDYFDDENWMALALIRAYDLTGSATYLSEAESLYADIMAGGWDTTCCGSSPGGIWWDRAHTEKATASNAGPVITGARLAERTDNPAYLPFAQKVYAYWAAQMVDPTTHQVFDHITSSGEIVKWKFTYNEGLFVGAVVELAKATGKPSTLAAATPVAGFMRTNETTTGSLGLALYDGTSSGCTGDCAEFKGIGFRYLTSLFEADASETSTRALLGSSAASVWQLARDPALDLFATDWTGPSQTKPTLEADSSATMALNQLAMMSGPYVSDGSKNTRLQAEEATIAGVGLEASHPGFEGWGYVAGWNADGQSVTFSFETTTAGNYALGLRFAAGAGVASRLVTIDGHTSAENLAFPATSSWDAYASVGLSASLSVGHHSVDVAFDSAKGSAGYLNLDELTLTPSP
jgi:predicted alpha-1,6-mannanase (GH76 family)